MPDDEALITPEIADQINSLDDKVGEYWNAHRESLEALGRIANNKLSEISKQLPGYSFKFSAKSNFGGHFIHRSKTRSNVYSTRQFFAMDVSFQKKAENVSLSKCENITRRACLKCSATGADMSMARELVQNIANRTVAGNPPDTAWKLLEGQRLLKEAQEKHLENRKHWEPGPALYEMGDELSLQLEQFRKEGFYDAMTEDMDQTIKQIGSKFTKHSFSYTLNFRTLLFNDQKKPIEKGNYGSIPSSEGKPSEYEQNPKFENKKVQIFGTGYFAVCPRCDGIGIYHETTNS